MPPLRSPLQQRDGNSRKAKELTPYQRGKIQGMADKGAGCTTISREYNLPLTTVYNTLRMDTLRDEGKSQPRSGAGKSYTEAEERRILRHVRSNPKDTYAQVITACSLGCKKNTVKKILKEHGIQNWKAKRRPFLTQKHADQRYAWCLRNQHRNPEEWGMVMWSDECSVERGRGKRDEWVFRTAT